MSIRTILLIIFSSAYAIEPLACSKAAEIDEDRSIIYSVCPGFAELSNDKASKLVKNLLSEYNGQPDEVLIYFLQSKNETVEISPLEEAVIGFYYTHDHKIVVWPNTQKERVIEPAW
ncbi:hypothetical protein KUV95_17190 [Microbulbifer agarilyticus]|uniref:hypothetical protein n=1 Tax=Microbulbifer agarilyticus TaxID=260552 RepID=UPI001C977129|nr:hypothetical protein [Microbulbifer agarilyticus]MBY6213281.1 hypothetical protein [Microbulbifer agarilyticus]